jgi:hypothetical protein
LSAAQTDALRIAFSAPLADDRKCPLERLPTQQLEGEQLESGFARLAGVHPVLAQAQHTRSQSLSPNQRVAADQLEREIVADPAIATVLGKQPAERALNRGDGLGHGGSPAVRGASTPNRSAIDRSEGPRIIPAGPLRAVRRGSGYCEVAN